MLKIGFNVTSRITPLEPDTKETPVQQQAEQPTEVQPKSRLVNSGPLRSEAMMSSIALRTQLNQQLETQPLKGNHDVVNSESLQHPEQIDRQAPLTQQEAEQQITDQPNYVNPFSRDEIDKGPASRKTIYTGDGNDIVRFSKDKDGLYEVSVNDKVAWSGTEREFRSLTIDTGAGNDQVLGSLAPNGSENYDQSGLTIITGDGDDVVFAVRGSDMKIDLGDGKDSLAIVGNNNVISSGEGDDSLWVHGDSNQISTGGQPQEAHVTGKDNKVDGFPIFNPLSRFKY